MNINYSQVAEQIFTTLVGANFKVESFDNAGEAELDPRQASRFVSPQLTVNLDRDRATVAMDVEQEFAQHDIIKSLKELAADHGLDFDYKVFGRSIKPKRESIMSAIGGINEQKLDEVLPAIAAGIAGRLAAGAAVRAGAGQVGKSLASTAASSAVKSALSPSDTKDLEDVDVEEAHDDDHNDKIYAQMKGIIKSIGDREEVASERRRKIFHPDEFADQVRFSVSSDKAQYAVTSRWGDFISRDEDGHFVAPRKIWSKIEQTAYDADGMGAEEIIDEGKLANWALAGMLATGIGAGGYAAGKNTADVPSSPTPHTQQSQVKDPWQKVHQDAVAMVKKQMKSGELGSDYRVLVHKAVRSAIQKHSGEIQDNARIMSGKMQATKSAVERELVSQYGHPSSRNSMDRGESMEIDTFENSDPSGIFHAAKYLNKSFLVKAEMAEGGTKTFRVKAQSERVAREKFAQHHAQAKVLSVKEEQGVAEGSDRDRTVHISKEDWNAFADWMESEGLGISEEDGIEHRDLGDVIELVYPPHGSSWNNDTSWSYATDWDVRDRDMSEGLSEMDKSQPSSDRGGESSGDPYAKGGKATPAKAKDVSKDALKLLKKGYNKSDNTDQDLEEGFRDDLKKLFGVIGIAGAIGYGAWLNHLATYDTPLVHEIVRQAQAGDKDAIEDLRNISLRDGSTEEENRLLNKYGFRSEYERKSPETTMERSTPVPPPKVGFAKHGRKAPVRMPRRSVNQDKYAPAAYDEKKAKTRKDIEDYFYRKEIGETMKKPRKTQYAPQDHVPGEDATQELVDLIKSRGGNAKRVKGVLVPGKKPGVKEEADAFTFWTQQKKKAGGWDNIDWHAHGVEHGKQGIIRNPPYGVGSEAVNLYYKGLKSGKQGMAEGTGVTDYNPKSHGGTRKELIARYHKTKDPKDARAARRAGATQKELQGVAEGTDRDRTVHISKDEWKEFSDWMESEGLGISEEDGIQHRDLGDVIELVYPPHDPRKNSATSYMYASEWDVRDRDMSESKIMEGFGHMLGSTKTSYQPLDGVKIIVRHKAPVAEEVRGSRSRNIKEIFIQRGDERFKMKEASLQAARAMARHVHSGGEVYDQIGKAINEMATEQKALANFVRFVSRSGMVNENNSEYVDLATKRVNAIRETFRKLMGPKTYANAVENINNEVSVELTETDLDLESKFTSISCDQRVTNAVASMRAALARQSAFESAIQEAINKEDFGAIKHRLQEQDAIEFENATARLAHQVSQLSNIAQDARLGTYLNNISKKIGEGIELEAFETKTVKLCLERARCKGSRKKMESQDPIKESKAYAQFIEKFDIF